MMDSTRGLTVRMFKCWCGSAPGPKTGNEPPGVLPYFRWFIRDLATDHAKREMFDRLAHVTALADQG